MQCRGCPETSRRFVSSERLRALAGVVVREGRKHTVVERHGVTVTVPRHRVLRTGTLRAILEEMNVGVDELISLLEGN